MNDRAEDRSSGGHRDSRLGGSPFWATRPSITAAVAYAAAVLVWVLAGSRLPDSRWLAVHLFTLGVLTNVVIVFSDHFGRTLTKYQGPQRGWYAPLVNVGIVAVLVGIPTNTSWLVASGAVTVTGVILASHGRLRHMVAAADERRFSWIPTVYLWAHAAFVVGAVLGMSMGVGWVSGSWYAAVRLAHLHVNVLGWGGLTVLATLTFFGPAMVRTRIPKDADDRAGRVLRLAAPALLVGALLLVLTGLDGVPGTAMRLAAAMLFAVFALATTVTCRPIAHAAYAANAGPTRRPVVAITVWFSIAVWFDVIVVATGRFDLLDAVGLAMFLGALAQLIATVMTYLVPMLRSRGFAGRDWLLGRLERREQLRTSGYNLGVVAIVGATILGGRVGWMIGHTGWLLLVSSIVWLAVAALAPLPTQGDAAQWQPRSEAARRYRTRHPSNE